ncbi:centrosomal protein of 192 kDa [Rhincodon typus]|uniref:centrosomal protein of 192 kDa n=1 Tax=Rhincodon typus TaxID=259920 RepID=UPI00202E386F|nr:centrosomal protein of 192 kDa [Rhincodon typus]
MESVRNLEDETFPSFLLQSERGNSSEILGNVTVSSNFGLPMAASTVAKNKSDLGNRAPDVQSSYLEEVRFSTVDTHSSNVLNSETCQKFALSFKDELEHVDDFLDAHCIPDVMEKHLDEFGSLLSKVNPQHALPGQHNNAQESSPVLDCLTDNEKGNKVDDPKDPGTSPGTKQTDEDLDIRRYSDSLASLLEDERLLSLASLEDQSTDDEFDAEAFGDERLDVYFKQLVPPGMQRGHTEGQELPEVHAALRVPSNNPTRWHQDNFQVPPVRQAATGMDSAPSSGELEAVRQSTLQGQLLISSSARQLLRESNHPSFRPGLEGGSSDESIGPLDEINDVGFEFRRRAEGQVINSPVVGDGGGGGDGSSGSEDDGNIGVSARLSNSTIYGDRWGCEMVNRNVAGEEGDHDSTVTVSSNTATLENLRGLGIMDRNVAGQDEPLSVPPSGGNREFIAAQNEAAGRLDPLGNGKVITAVPGIPLNLSSRRSSTRHHQEASDVINTSVYDEPKLDSVYFRPVSGNVTTDDQLFSTVQGTPFRLSQITCTSSGNDVTDLRDGPSGDTVGHMAARGRGDADKTLSADSGPPLAAAYLSPVNPDGSTSETWTDSSKSSPFHKQRKADWNAGCSQWDNEKGETQSVVYQNEEGNWVTDLAYYYSLDKEQDQFNLPTDLVNSIQEEAFITGNKAVALIEEDQEQFEEENKFIQDDKMDATFTEGLLGNDSWQLPANSYLMLRASRAGSDFMQGSQSYLRLTLGEFFGERSEALGCLGEQNSGIKRPSFGYSITSPERRAPVALFEPDLSKDHSETPELGNDNALHSVEPASKGGVIWHADLYVAQAKLQLSGNTSYLPWAMTPPLNTRLLSHLLILVSPNPSLIAKPSAVPWSGKIYVQCDNIQQLIKVQIREDVIMDTSASVLSPSAVLDMEPWTPNLNLAKPLLISPPTKLKIKNRTVHFPSTSAGSTSESLLEIENGGEETVQWFLSSFAPPYVKWVDESGDIYRATYTVFRCSRLSGTLQALSKEKLPIMFMPRDKGDYSQFWDLECRLAAEPHRKHKIQFQLHGAGSKAKESSKETDSATKLVKTETAMKTRKSISERLARKGQEQPPFKGVFAPEDLYSFPATPVGESSTLKINLRNSSSVAHMWLGCLPGNSDVSISPEVQHVSCVT